MSHPSSGGQAPSKTLTPTKFAASGAFEGCCTRVSDETESSDLKALGRIAMEVMQGGQFEDMDTIGVKDLSTWDSDAASFLAETTSATLPDELKKVSRASLAAASC